MFVLFGAILVGFASCGGGEAAPADGAPADTTHVEGDGHSH